MFFLKKNLVYQIIIFSLLSGLANISFASGETNYLPYACEKKLLNYSKKKLEKLMIKTEVSVSNLPELKNLSSSVQKDNELISLNKKIVYSSTLIEESLSINPVCFSEVSVYIDDSEKKHLWNTFLVDIKGVPKAIKNSDGDFITLKQWREKTDSHESNCIH